MTAKEYLNQYYDLTEEIKILEEEVRSLEEDIDSMQLVYDGMPKGNEKSDKTGSRASRIADVYLELMDVRTSAWEKRKEIVLTINKVKDGTLKKILYMKYVRMKRFEAIAVSIDKGYRHTLRLHGEALKKVEKLL